MENKGTIGTDKGLYLYCFFKKCSSISSEKGIDGVNDTFVLSYQRLCALVSSVSLDEYNETALNQKLEDLKWLTSKVKRHEELIRSVMEVCPVVPVGFGTIYKSDEKVLELLCNGYEEFIGFLDYVQDKEEWGVKVYVDEEICRKIVEERSNTISELDQKLSSLSSGKAYFLRKKKENLIQQEMPGFLDELSDEIYQKVVSLSVESRINKLLSKDATGKDEEMILNTALLLKKQEVESFKKKLDEIATSYESYGLLFEFSGPWPPYNFCPAFSAFKGEERL